MRLGIGSICLNAAGDIFKIIEIESDCEDYFIGNVIWKVSDLVESDRIYRFFDNGKYADSKSDSVSKFDTESDMDLVDEYHFDKMIFLGSRDRSKMFCDALHGKLERALSVLCGLQQIDFYDEEGEQKLENRVREIVMALTGKEIEFKE